MAAYTNEQFFPYYEGELQISREIVAERDKEYGGTPMSEYFPDEASFFAQVEQKYLRMKSLVRTKNLQDPEVQEKLVDTCRDLANYALFLSSHVKLCNAPDPIEDDATEIGVVALPSRTDYTTLFLMK